MLDIAGLLAGWGVDFAAARTQLLALYEEVDARAAAQTRTLDLPCHRGCDMCCHQSVFVTPIEFFTMWDWAQTHLDQACRNAMVGRGLALYAEHAAAIEALERPPPHGARDHFAVACQLRFTCPNLADDGACLVYPARELLARLFGCSFNDTQGVYGCHIVARHLAGLGPVTLMPARGTARRLRDLPLSDRRQVYPYYFQAVYG